MTEAVLFRKIEKDRPTVLMDEVDSIFGTYAEKTEPVRALINSGNRRGGVVARCVGKAHEVRDFAVFSAKCLAGIETGRLPETIRDRSIVIWLKRKRDEKVERFRRRTVKEESESLQAELSAWAAANMEQLKKHFPDLPPELNDRAAEGWEPLLAIADVIGGDWPAKAREAAVALSADDDVEDDSWGVQLLADLRRIWNPELGLRLFSWELCYLLNEEDGSPWKNWGRNRKVGGFTPRDLAQHLRRYSIKPKTIRVGEVTKKGYDYEDFEDAWARYLPPVEDQEDAS